MHFIYNLKAKIFYIKFSRLEHLDHVFQIKIIKLFLIENGWFQQLERYISILLWLVLRLFLVVILNRVGGNIDIIIY